MTIKKTVTEKQLAANRKNALLGGPRTPEGIARSSQNAITYGIFAHSIVIDEIEKAEDFEQLVSQLTAELKPEGLTENFRLLHIARDMWALNRLHRAEIGSIKRGRAETMKRQVHEKYKAMPLDDPQTYYSRETSAGLRNLGTLMVKANDEVREYGVILDETTEKLATAWEWHDPFIIHQRLAIENRCSLEARAHKDSENLDKHKKELLWLIDMALDFIRTWAIGVAKYEKEELRQEIEEKCALDVEHLDKFGRYGSRLLQAIYKNVEYLENQRDRRRLEGQTVEPSVMEGIESDQVQ